MRLCHIRQLVEWLWTASVTDFSSQRVRSDVWSLWKCLSLVLTPQYPIYLFAITNIGYDRVKIASTSYMLISLAAKTPTNQWDTDNSLQCMKAKQGLILFREIIWMCLCLRAPCGGLCFSGMDFVPIFEIIQSWLFFCSPNKGKMSLRKMCIHFN